MSNGKIVLEDSAVEFLKEEVGGGTYTSGNGITITEDNVINADTKVVVWNKSIDKIPSYILESLNVGDILKQWDHYQFVYSKNQFDIMIIQVEPNCIETFFFKKDGEDYKYDHQVRKDFPLYDGYAYLEGTQGTIDANTYDSIISYGYCGIERGIAVISGFDEEKDTIKLSTVVQDNEYYTVSFTHNEPEGEVEEESFSYVITEHTVGGRDIPIRFFNIEDYSTDAELTPPQWDNRAMYEACQDYLCFIGDSLHNQKAFVSFADFNSTNGYIFDLTGSTIEPGGDGGFGWDQENQCFFRAGDPK